nr:hypothetical protein [Henriciella sp.]
MRRAAIFVIDQIEFGTLNHSFRIFEIKLSPSFEKKPADSHNTVALACRANLLFAFELARAMNLSG